MAITDIEPLSPLTGHEELRRLYLDEYRSLVKLASLLLDDRGACEEVVQDAFVRTLVAWPGLRDHTKAPAFLRSAVLNAARSRMRRLSVVRRHSSSSGPGSVEGADRELVEHAVVVAELRRLPARQREAVALRYYLDLSEADIAEAMGCSPGSVKTHLHRALATLATRLEEQ
jgi:RNA polymerase sigma-70 factor (sigma-E family)